MQSYRDKCIAQSARTARVTVFFNFYHPITWAATHYLRRRTRSDCRLLVMLTKFPVMFLLSPLSADPLQSAKDDDTTTLHHPVLAMSQTLVC